MKRIIVCLALMSLAGGAAAVAQEVEPAPAYSRQSKGQ